MRVAHGQRPTASFAQIDCPFDAARRCNDYGRYTELRMDHEADPQAIFGTRFWTAAGSSIRAGPASLHDIFVRIAGAEAQRAGGGHGPWVKYWSSPLANTAR